MSKKKNKQHQTAAAERTVEGEGFSPLGLRFMSAGVVSIAAGFLILSKADPMARNWAGTWSPFVILGGYALVGLGVFWRDGGEPVSPPSTQAPQP